MRILAGLRSFVLCLGLCLVGLVVCSFVLWSSVAFGGGRSSGSRSGLFLPGGGSLVGMRVASRARGGERHGGSRFRGSRVRSRRRLVRVGRHHGTGSPGVARGRGVVSGGVGLPMDSLVVPAAQLLDGGQQVVAAEEARLTDPEVVVEREESRTKFENLGAGEAEVLAGEVFPGLIDDLEGGPPRLSAGQEITSFQTDNIARVDLGGGKRGVIESAAPLATVNSVGQRVPLDLSLSDVGGAFEPVTAAVGVWIPKRLSEGVRLANVGVSLTPVNGSGLPVGGSEGTVDGASAFFANTQTDTDTVVKPTATGLEVDALLRAADSPTQLYFKVGLPQGAQLVQGGRGSAVKVVSGGQVIASIPVPGASDAAGVSVPVSMSVSGDTLVLTAGGSSGEYDYPIDVDPTVEAWTSLGLNWKFHNQSYGNSWWEFYTPYESVFGSGANKGYLLIAAANAHTAGQWGEFYYQTQRASQIYGVDTYTTDTSEGEALKHESETIETLLYIDSAKGVESTVAKLPVNGHAETKLCVEPCSSPKVETERQSNLVVFEQYAAASATYNPTSSEMSNASVNIVQEKGPSVSLNSTSEKLSGSPNLLYSGKWVSTKMGRYAVGASATDPGLGIWAEKWSSPSAPKWGNSRVLQEEERGYLSPCKGVQCEESASPIYLSEEALPEGEDTVQLQVEDPVGLSATATANVKIDNSAPHNITLTGLPSGNEIGEYEYHVKVKAVDGSGSTPSSGVKSIALTVDGREVGKPSGFCSPGPCTATGEWTINGAEFGDGEHELVVNATDNAGNVAKSEVSLQVYHAASVGLGPGSVNTRSGEYDL